MRFMGSLAGVTIMRRGRQSLVWAMVCTCLIASGRAIGQEAPTTEPSSPTRQQLIAEMETYYAKLYEKPLAQKVRLARLVAVMSLSRIDGPALTESLVKVLKDDDLLVAQLAWEALNARQASLSGAQRTAWLDGGLEIARRGGFPGATAAPLVSALSERPAAASKTLLDLLIRVAAENDPARDAGRNTLDTVRAAVARWQDPRLAQALLSRVTSNARYADRFMRMLGGLPGAPEAGADRANRAAWTRFGRDLKITPPAELPPYQGKSDFFAAPAVIDDPSDAKWRKELELPALRLEAMEIVYCIDATPSMEVSNPYVAGYVETISRLFETMSSGVKSGAVYYRHETDDALKADCCRKVKTTGDDFAVKVIPLAADPKVMIGQMRAMKIGGSGTGHGGEGAYVAGIDAAMRQVPWSASGRRVIVMTGDAKPTPGSEAALVQISQRARTDGFNLIFMARDKRASDAVAAASDAVSSSPPILYGGDIKKAQTPASTDATAGFHGTAFEAMAVRVLQQTLPESYRDRAEPLINAIMPIVQAKAELGK